jgi:hypothetical protein
MTVPPFDLAGDGVGVDDRAALVSGDDPGHGDLAAGTRVDLGAGGHPAVLLQPHRTAPTGTARRSAARAGIPAGPRDGRAEHVSQPLVSQVTEPEGKRVGARRVSELVDARLAGKGVRGRRQRPAPLARHARPPSPSAAVRPPAPPPAAARPPARRSPAAPRPVCRPPCPRPCTARPPRCPSPARPHWDARSSASACWTGCSRPFAARPSIVVTDLPATSPTVAWQASTGAPSTSTEQAPHSPVRRNRRCMPCRNGDTRPQRQVEGEVAAADDDVTRQSVHTVV